MSEEKPLFSLSDVRALTIEFASRVEEFITKIQMLPEEERKLALWDLRIAIDSSTDEIDALFEDWLEPEEEEL